MKITERFLYKSSRHPNKAIVIGQLENYAFCIVNAVFLTEDENQFNTIKDIEEYIDDELEMIRKIEDT